MTSREFAEWVAWFFKLGANERFDDSWMQTDLLARAVLAPYSKREPKEGAFIPGYRRPPQTEEEQRAELMSYFYAQKVAAKQRKRTITKRTILGKR